MALRSINKQNSPSDGRRAFTFSVAALCVIICFAASAIPVPLIAIWTQALALTTFEVSMTVFAYVGGCLAVLLFFSKLSNYFGRKITVILALAVGIASCLCFCLSAHFGAPASRRVCRPGNKRRHELDG